MLSPPCRNLWVVASASKDIPGDCSPPKFLNPLSPSPKVPYIHKTVMAVRPCTVHCRYKASMGRLMHRRQQTPSSRNRLLRISPTAQWARRQGDLVFFVRELIPPFSHVVSPVRVAFPTPLLQRRLNQNWDIGKLSQSP